MEFVSKVSDQNTPQLYARCPLNGFGASQPHCNVTSHVLELKVVHLAPRNIIPNLEGKHMLIQSHASTINHISH